MSENDKGSDGAGQRTERWGAGSFVIQARGPILSMLIHGKPIAQARMKRPEVYDELFDEMKARIKALSKESEAPSPAAEPHKGPSSRAPERLRGPRASAS
jgi:hypothetical protein